MDGLKAILIIDLLFSISFFAGYVIGSLECEEGKRRPFKATLYAFAFNLVLALFAVLVGDYG